MDFPVHKSEFREQEALSSARRATFQDNLIYLHANIGYYLDLDVDQSHKRLNEISAIVQALLEQLTPESVDAA